MRFEMRRETLKFVEHAPVVRATAAEVAVPRERVFEAIADPSSWIEWFPNVRSAEYTSQAPHGPGASPKYSAMTDCRQPSPVA